MCWSAERELEGDPAAVGLGRRFVHEVLVAWGLSDVDPAWDRLGDALLVASELLTNSLRAGARSMWLTVQVHEHRIRVGVRDDVAAPARRRTGAPDNTGGRGIPIVDRLSARWGQSAFDGQTKTVWAEFDVPPGSVLAPEHCAAAAARG
jgi:hypothetical protein